MDETIRALNYTLDCASQRLRWHIESGYDRYFTECDMYLRVANIYMNEIIKEQKHETCESQY